MTIGALRRKIAKSISGTGLPGSRQLGELVRSQEGNAEIQQVAKMLMEGIIEREKIVNRLMQNASVARWLTDDALRQMGAFDRKLPIQMAIGFMVDTGTDEQIAAYFDKYVTTEARFNATIETFLRMLQKLTEWGYFIHYPDREPASNITEEDLPILFDRTMGWVAENLVKADKSLDYDLVKADLKEVVFKRSEQQRD